MTPRRFLRWSGVGSLVLLMACALAPAAQLMSAATRVEHGRQSFDLPLSRSGNPTIEPRNTRGGLTLVLGFDEPVEQTDVRIESGTARVGAVRYEGKTMLVPLSRLADAQQITIAVGGADRKAEPARVTFRVLEGDVNADARVDQDDLDRIAALDGQAVTAANFRFDVQGSGRIDRSDVRATRAKVGGVVPGLPQDNTPPWISSIPEQRDIAGRTPAGIGFVVKDAETPAEKLYVTATSDNPAMFPPGSILISGDGEARVLTANAATKTGGRATITVKVSDGLLESATSFEMNLDGSPTLFIAQMTPQGGAQTLASGQATLLLAGDEQSAVLRFNYSNLTGPETAAHIHGPADPGQAAGILFDIDVTPPNSDGSYTWVITPTGGHSVADQVNYIRQGKTYINIHTAAYPNGEIRGQFQQASGSQTFTPPGPPPSLPTDPPTAAEAARFLTQATYGVTEEEISRVMAMGYEAWIEDQFSRPQTKMLDIVLTRISQGDRPDLDSLFTETWWRVALTGQDQLRQRVAFALSQILVISQNDGDIAQRPREQAYYYDMLARNAFGNYRTLLEDVTLNPEMGQYLDMRGSKKLLLSGNPPAPTRIPNENYPREVLQLFSIGKYQLHPDGTLKLGDTGLPIETYDQSVIDGLSRVFSGWSWRQSGQASSPAADYFNPMTPIVNDHDFGDTASNNYYGGGRKLLDGLVLPNRTATVANAYRDLADALNQIHNHNNTGPFICKQLIQRLVTSNPSPGYVYRVSQAFANNGDGVRGDFKAVIKAILLDWEARAGYDLNKFPVTPVYTQGFGKVREPILRMTAAVRPFRPYSASGWFRVPITDTQLAQSPLRADTVFNFFEPTYSQPGAIAQEGLLAPELQILSEITVVNAANTMETAVRTALPGTDVRVDFSVEQSLASNPAALVDRLDLLLMYGEMSKDNNPNTNDMRQRIINHINTISAASPALRVQAAVHLIVTSPEYCAQR